MIRIRNHYEELFSTKMMIDCLYLLPKEYMSLNIKIIIFKNRFDALIYNILHCRIGMGFRIFFTKSLGGSSNKKLNMIYLYPFNYDFNDKKYGEIEKLRFVNAIYHEMHHQYQRQRRKEFFDNYEKKYHKKITYENSLIETEARRFANKISSKYCHEIWKILGV